MLTQNLKEELEYIIEMDWTPMLGIIPPLVIVWGLVMRGVLNDPERKILKQKCDRYKGRRFLKKRI